MGVLKLIDWARILDCNFGSDYEVVLYSSIGWHLRKFCLYLNKIREVCVDLAWCCMEEDSWTWGWGESAFRAKKQSQKGGQFWE